MVVNKHLELRKLKNKIENCQSIEEIVEIIGPHIKPKVQSLPTSKDIIDAAHRAYQMQEKTQQYDTKSYQSDIRWKTYSIAGKFDFMDEVQGNLTIEHVMHNCIRKITDHMLNDGMFNFSYEKYSIDFSTQYKISVIAGKKEETSVLQGTGITRKDWGWPT